MIYVFKIQQYARLMLLRTGFWPTELTNINKKHILKILKQLLKLSVWNPFIPHDVMAAVTAVKVGQQTT